MIKRKKSVLAVTILAIGSLVALHFYNELKSSRPVVLQVDGFPMIGDSEAKIEIVLFEDLRCGGCQYFDQEIYPQLRAEYIETGKVRFVAIPLAFLDNSQRLANAAWAVYEQNPKLFFPYVSELFRHSLSETFDTEVLVSMAEEVGKINPEKLESCIETHCYYDVLDKNLEWAEKLMGKDFGTPTLYVNGIRTSAGSLRAIEEQIKRLTIR